MVNVAADFAPGPPFPGFRTAPPQQTAANNLRLFLTTKSCPSGVFAPSQPYAVLSDKTTTNSGADAAMAVHGLSFAVSRAGSASP